MDENQNREATEDLGAQEAPQMVLPVKKIISLVIGLVLVAIFLIVFFVFILPRFSKNTPKDVTLIYWGIWEDASPFAEVAAEWTRQNPNIKIKYEKQDIKSLGKYIDRLATRIDNGTGPDIFRYHNSWIMELKPLLLPLPEDVVKTLELDNKFYPVVSSDIKIKGAYYGVPINFDTLAMFVNTQILNAAGILEYPKTWDDLASVARLLTVKDSEGKIVTSGAALGVYSNIAHASDIVSLLLIQNGADIKNLAGPSKQNALDALEFYTSFAKGEGKVWDGSLENSKLAFAKGNLALYFGYSWDIFEIKALNPNLEFAVVSVPSLPQRKSTIASYWVEGVSAKSKFSKEAFQFLKFLASRKTMEKLYALESKTRLFGELYPRSDMAELLKDNTLIYAFIEQGKEAKSTIFSSDTYDEAMVDGLNSYMANALNSIVNDNTSFQTALDTLSGGVSQILERYENNKSQ